MINDSPLLTRYFSIKSYYYYIYIMIWLLPVARCIALRRSKVSLDPLLQMLGFDESIEAATVPREDLEKMVLLPGDEEEVFFFDQKKRPWEKIRFLNGLYGKNPSFFLKTNPRFFQWHSTKTIRNEEKLICSMAFSNFLIFYGIL